MPQVRNIKSRERDNGMKYCSFCKPEKVRAVYRNTGFSIDQHVSLACALHVIKLPLFPIRAKASSNKHIEREYYTEADHQTWMRI